MSYLSIESALVAQLIADSPLLTAQNLLKRDPHGSAVYLMRNFNNNFSGSTLYGGGQKREGTPHIWTWNIIIEFLVRGVKPGDVTVGEGRVLELQDSIGLTDWRRKSRLGGACLRSAVASINQPVIVSYQQVDFYLLSVTIQADEDYKDYYGD